MTIIGNIYGLVREMLDVSIPLPSVHTEVTSTTVDAAGYPVIHVTAGDYAAAADVVAKTTYPGDVHRAVVHTGFQTWEIRIEAKK